MAANCGDFTIIPGIHFPVQLHNWSESEDNMCVFPANDEMVILRNHCIPAKSAINLDKGDDVNCKAPFNRVQYTRAERAWVSPWRETESLSSSAYSKYLPWLININYS